MEPVRMTPDGVIITHDRAMVAMSEYDYKQLVKMYRKKGADSIIDLLVLEDMQKIQKWLRWSRR